MTGIHIQRMAIKFQIQIVVSGLHQQFFWNLYLILDYPSSSVSICVKQQRKETMHSGITVTFRVFFLYEFCAQFLSAINHHLNVNRWKNEKKNFSWYSQYEKKARKKKKSEIVNVDEYVILFFHHDSSCHLCYRDGEKKVGREKKAAANLKEQENKNAQELFCYFSTTFLPILV